MAIDFPATPALNEVYLYNGTKYVWDGVKWVSGGQTSYDALYAQLSGDTFTGNVGINADLTVDTDTLHVDSANNRVGIGTTSPVYRVDAQGGRALFSANSEVYSVGVRNRTSLAPNGNYWLGATNTVSPDLLFSNNAGNTRMCLTDAGNLGVGTTSPACILDVNNIGRFLSATPSYPSTGKGVEVYFDSAGDLGYIQAYDRTGAAWKGLTLAGDTLQMRTAGNERMRIDSSGNVGVGTTNPAADLHISSRVCYF